MSDRELYERVERLEADVYHIKKNMLHRDEVKEKVWNDLQEDLLHLVRKDHEYIKQIDTRTQRLESKMDVMQGRMERVESDVSTLKSDMSEVKAMLREVLNKR